MATQKSGNVFIAVGGFFVAYYLVARWFLFRDHTAALVLRDSLSQIEQSGLVGFLTAHLSSYLIAYLVFAYSFKLGVVLLLIGGALKSNMESRGVWLFAIGGVVYLALSYIPIGYSPLFFGVQGIAILLLFLLIVHLWMKKRPQLDEQAKAAGDYRIVGYFFFIVATWNLCGIFGLAAFALKPEMMIEHGLQPNAITMTSHVMIELLLGWLFVFLAMYKENQPQQSSE
jgi:uncharacterized membrane protein